MRNSVGKPFMSAIRFLNMLSSFQSIQRSRTIPPTNPQAFSTDFSFSLTDAESPVNWFALEMANKPPLRHVSGFFGLFA